MEKSQNVRTKSAFTPNYKGLKKKKLEVYSLNNSHSLNNSLNTKQSPRIKQLVGEQMTAKYQGPFGTCV